MDIKALRTAYSLKYEEARAALTAEPFDEEKATALKDEAKALQARIKAFEDLGPAPKVETEAKPQKSGLTVVADEEDKKKTVKTWGAGEFLAALALRPEEVRAYRSRTEPDHYNFTEALGQKAIGSLAGARQKAITGMSESVPADGGFLVQTDWGGALMERVYNTGRILSMVTTTSISANANGISFYASAETSRADGSRAGGVRYYWVAEGGDKTISNPTYRKIEMQLGKLVVRVPATDELLQDTTALASELGRIAPLELRFGVEDAIVNGTGAGVPTGIMASPALISQAAEAAQVAATIVSQNIINMWARRWVGYTDYVWLIDQSCEPQLMQMNLGVGTGGILTYMPPGGLSATPYGSLFGRPVIPTEYNAVLGTTGDIILWSPSSYRMIEKGGIQSASSIHVRWANDETEFRFVLRTMGTPEWNLALTPNSGGNTQGPMVVLDTRS
jgi:HK97 family phage major capsid protein